MPPPLYSRVPPSHQQPSRAHHQQRPLASLSSQSASRQTALSLDNVPTRARASLVQQPQPWHRQPWEDDGDEYGHFSQFEDDDDAPANGSTASPPRCRRQSTDTLRQTPSASSRLSAGKSRSCSPTPSELDALEELTLGLDDLSLAGTASCSQALLPSQQAEHADASCSEEEEFFDSHEVSAIFSSHSSCDDELYSPPLSQSTSSGPELGLPSSSAAKPVDYGSHQTWPNTPSFTGNPPFVAVWELTRVALHCKVGDPSSIALAWQPEWKDLSLFWAALKQHPALAGQRFPPKSDPQAWLLGLDMDQHEDSHPASSSSSSSSCASPSSSASSPQSTTPLRAVVLTASMHLIPTAARVTRSAAAAAAGSIPPLRLELNPLLVEKSSRLLRHFGWDRFLEVRIPSLETWPENPSQQEDKEAVAARWLVGKPHAFLHREWAAFYVRDQPFKVEVPDLTATVAAQGAVHDGAGSTKALYYDRVMLFAQRGRDLPGPPSQVPPWRMASSGRYPRTGLHRNSMLGWLLEWEENMEEPYLKLFQRTALGLSRTTPVLLLPPSQIRDRHNDLRSPTTQAVMNDGAARMSPRLMRRVRDALGLPSIPSAIQGRLGSAKGMWVVDVEETDDQAEWIETFPKQRKWAFREAAGSNLHAAHRTLEVMSWSADLVPASLNAQFLPILDDRARDAQLLRDTLAGFLVADAREETEALVAALRHDEAFRKWVHGQTRGNIKYLGRGGVPFLGGLPQSTEDAMSFLADGGFSALRLAFLQTLVFQTMKQKTDKKKEELKIRVPRSTYAYILPDFWGVLEPGEVHLSFATRFCDGTEELSDLDGMEVLVARSPAHLPSDVQKVRARFKSELRHLRDVAVFSTKGDEPLAAMLSGGDYDGDKVWVCWDPALVGNFRNHAMPPKLDLGRYIRKDGDRLLDLYREYGSLRYIDVMLERAFRFNLHKRFLGPCTIYKEKLAYHRFSVSSPQIIHLSWLLSELADQAKQGIIFGQAAWTQFQLDVLGTRRQYPMPAYKKTPRPQLRPNAANIVDHLMFQASAVVDGSLRELHRSLQGSGASTMDEDVVGYWNCFERTFSEMDGQGMPRCAWFLALRDGLKRDVEACMASWARLRMGGGGGGDGDGDEDPEMDYAAKVRLVYADWREIQPRFVESSQGKSSLAASAALSMARKFLTAQGGFHRVDADYSQWELLKASWAFKHFHHRKTRFVWQMCGRQLQALKALASSSSPSQDAAPLMTTARMYAALKPDSTYIKQLVAMEEQGEVASSAQEEGEDTADGLNGEMLLWEASLLSQE